MRLRSVPVATLALASLARAQGNEPLRQPSSVPIELATALAMAGGFAGDGDPQILVGAAPEWIAAKVPAPRRAQLLGSAFIGTTTLMVFTYPSAADTVLKVFERELTRGGWKAPPPPPSYGGGFRPAPTAAVRAALRRVTLCGDRQILIGSIVKQRADLSTIALRVSASPASGYSQCSPPQMPQGMSSMSRNPYPTLYNPDGSDGMSIQSCYEAGSMGGTGTQTRLRTPMTPDAIIEHYGRQLQDSGWTSQLAMPVTAVSRSWTRRDSTGATIAMTLTVSIASRDSLCRDVNLEVRGPREAQRRP